MKVTRQEMKEGLLEIDVEVEAEEVEEAYDEVYSNIAQEITVPGFRKGKAPRRLIEARTTPDLLKEEITKHMGSKAYAYAVEELGLQVIKDPDIEGDIEQGETSTFTIKVEVIPKIDLGPYRDLKIEIERLEVTDREIEEQLSLIQEKHATLTVSHRDVVEMGDYVTLTIDGYDEGEFIPSLSQSDIATEIGSNSIQKEIEEGCIGLRLGEEASFEVHYPMDDEDSDRAGKRIEYKVTVKDIKEKVLPPMDDEFATNYAQMQGIDHIHSLDGLKEAFKIKLEEISKINENTAFERGLLDAIAMSSEYTLHDSVVENELQHLVDEAIKQLRKQGTIIDEKDETSMNTLRRQYHPQAVTNVTDALILDTLAKKEGFKVETEELDTRLGQLARENKMEKKIYRRKVFKENRLDSIKKKLLREKALSFLHEHNYAAYPSEEKEENIEIDV